MLLPTKIGRTSTKSSSTSPAIIRSILHEKLQQLAGKLGPDRIRLALPPLTRKWEEKGLLHKIHELRSAGWNRWEAGNLSAWSYLDFDPRRRRQRTSTSPPIGRFM